MITKETLKETPQTIVTICNYDRYNLNSGSRKQGKKQQGNSEETPEKQSGNTEETNKNKGNKGKKENNNPLSLFGELDLENCYTALSNNAI